MRALFVVGVVVLAGCGPLAPPRADSGSGGGEATGGGIATGGGMNTGGGGVPGCDPSCTAPTNATVDCANGCNFICDPGFHRCGDHCAADDSVNECGASCESCPGNGGIAACVSNICDFSCGANQARCGTRCVPSSNTACGSTCEMCDPGESCINDVCRIACDIGEVEVNGRCVEGRELATGTLHACARHDGGAVCWGPGSTGALGRGAYDGGRSPQHVLNLAEVASIETGDLFSCALLPNGSVRCWGDNQFGQVGNGGTQASFLPALTMSADVTSLRAGSRHACVMRTDAGVSCWGNGTVGQLGDGMSALGVRSPQHVALMNGTRQLFVAADAVWAISNDGGVWFWGDDPLVPFTLAPQRIDFTDGGLHRVVSGANHACAIREDTRTLECWGRGQEGQLGYAVAGTAAQPVRAVPGLGRVIDVCAGLNFSCAIIDDGGVRCFGTGTSGELGGGNYMSSTTPVAADGLPAARQLSCHHQFVCAKTNDAVYCWGDNAYGQLGAASPVNSATPIIVPMP